MSEAGRILGSEMRERPAFRGLPLAGAGVAGTLTAHWLAYLVSIPQARVRAAALAGAGHGYWGSALKLAVVLALAGLGALAIRAGSTPQGELSGLGAFMWVLRRLVLLQVVLFAAMEVFERLVSGAPLGGLLGHDLFVLGLLLQVLVAAALALVLVAFGWTAVHVWGRLFRRTFVRPPRALVPAGVTVPRAPILRGATGVRAPPTR
jgi:hypothetical protein